jgi:HK97 family phage portal protein
MSLFFRKTERRAITSVPWNVGGPLRTAVNQERALALSPVFAAVRHITDMGSTLPLKSYQKVGESRRPMDLPEVFASLERAGSLIPWLSQGLSSLVLRGNAVGLIASSDGMGFPTSVAWLSMDRVHVDDSTGAGIWYVDGRQVSRLDLVHIPWVTIPGRTLGLSPIEYYAVTINAGLDSQQYGSDWFKNGGVPPSTFQNTGKTVDASTAEKISDRLASAIRRRKPLVYGSDWKYDSIAIPPNESQFIETQKLTAAQVAAIYGLDAVEIGGEAANGLTYTNEEHRQTKRLANLRPYLTRFERAFASWLPERQYVKFNGDAIVRADIKTRHEVYEIQSRIGLLTVNEQRALEELPPIEGGDAIESKKQRDLAETLQKIYLAVGTVITTEEAREIANAAGGDLALPGPTFAPSQPAAQQRRLSVIQHQEEL